MSRQKKFKAYREPEYKVITACFPEAIDGISLKVRDLHTIYAIMRDYTHQYILSIEEEHRRCGTVIDLHASPATMTRQLEDLVRIMFSAQLSTYESLIFYIKEALMGNQTALDWLEKYRAKTEALNAFERLRNMDVHHEPLHSLMGMRYRVLGASSPPYSEIASKEIHQHLALGHEGIGLAPWRLEETKQFRNQPGLVELLTYESILQLSHRCIHEIVGLLEEGMSNGFFKVAKVWSCHICSAQTAENSPRHSAPQPSTSRDDPSTSSG